MKEKIKSDNFIKIEKIVKSEINHYGYNLVDIDAKTYKTDLIITIFVYKDKEMDIESLGKLNKKIYPLLSEAGFKSNVILEISSPGIYRKINFIYEFDIFKDRPIKIIDDTNTEISGINKGIVDDKLIILKDNKEIIIKFDNIKKARLNG